MNEVQRNIIVTLLANDVAHQNLDEWKFEKKLHEMGLTDEYIEIVEDAIQYYRENRR